MFENIQMFQKEDQKMVLADEKNRSFQEDLFVCLLLTKMKEIKTALICGFHWLQRFNGGIFFMNEGMVGV